MFTGAKPSSVTQRGKTEPFEVQISRQDIAFHNQFELGCFTNSLGTAAATPIDRKSTRLNSSHSQQSRMPSSA